MYCAVTADLDTSYIRSSKTQSRSPPIRWRYTYDDDDPDTIWAALVALLQTSFHGDLVGDICPDHIDIYAEHCRSLVLALRHHGSSIRCPAFGSYSETACQSPATAGFPRGWQKKIPDFSLTFSTTNKSQSLSRYIPCGDFCDVHVFKTTKNHIIHQ